MRAKTSPFGINNFLWNPTGIRATIVNDDNDRPGSRIEAYQTQPIEQLENGQTSQINFKFPNAFRLDFLKPGDKAWIILHNTGARLYGGEHPTCGTPEPGHALFWHHNGGSDGISAIRTVCRTIDGQRSPGLTDTSTGWVVNATAPTYTHTFFDSFTHIVEAADQESIDKYGEVDSFIDANWITDEDTMSSFLGSFIQYAAKPRRIYEMSEVYIPYLSPIAPGSLVTVVDTKSGLTANKNTLAEVQEVRYEFSAESAGRSPLGTNTCEVRLLGYVDYKESMVLIHQQEVLELPPEPPGGEPHPEAEPHLRHQY